MSAKPRQRGGKRGLGRFRKVEVARVTRAVRLAGGGTVKLDPETGKYTIAIASQGASPDTTTNPWDAVHAADKDRAS